MNANTLKMTEMVSKGRESSEPVALLTRFTRVRAKLGGLMSALGV